MVGSRLLGLCTLLLAVAAAAAVAPPPVQAAERTGLTADSPPARVQQVVEVTFTLDAGTGPLAGATLGIERRVGGEWRPLADRVTDEDGVAAVEISQHRRPADNVVRARYAGDEIHDPAVATHRVRLLRRTGRVTLSGPTSFVDETTTPLTARWRGGRIPVQRGRVELQRKDGRRWVTARRGRTDARGRVSFTVSPRTDTRWRVVARRLAWVTGDRSPVHALDNLPPGTPVRLPAAAPRPRPLPAQAHAVGSGPNARITTVPDRVWRQMTGRSWHAGCPVGRGGLRLLRINYWDYDGYRRRGELVAASGAIGKMAGAIAAMYRRKLPIRSMYRVDRFGWSSRLHGADDYRSMATGNTSAFNCRDVVGRPGVRSPHSYGRALDINPWENPYTSPQGVYPNRWWKSRSHPRVAWRSRDHAVVRIMTANAMAWTYGASDLHHFDARVSGRVVAIPGCGETVCH
ncbi:M15 family metallopeptidase [Nocardioides sambongensis]|uniref:M15 family metallopeptidase n=1 Tax=Nocardioides sambongensis TaxID=2589074 RepID=UPI00112DE15D|nr:M15 family metallopeptidase [Nocardioides sambongensis]